jgi:hypothetical protein
VARELRQHQTAGCQHVALEITYSNYPAQVATAVASFGPSHGTLGG